MKALHVGAGFALPASITEDVIAILGRRGRGKTTTAAVIVEELHAAGARFCAVDPTGAWWGLKSSRDGRAPGIPCVVMGGEHGDVPLAAESGEIIADFVADPTGPSCVLDLKPFHQAELVRFMTAFLARLYHKNTHPLHLVLDEADQFAPQRPMHGEEAMLGAAQRVTKMGRVKGLHPILITQRPATLSKNVLTQAGMLIAHAITGPQDRKAIDEWIKANAEEDERIQFLEELGGLPRGTAYFWSPDLPLFRQVEVRDRRTFDSSATPGQAKRVQPKALAAVDLEGLKSRIAATIEKAKAEDPRELRKTIAELRAELKAAKATPASVKTTTREVPILKDGQVKRLEAAVARCLTAATRASELHDGILAAVAAIKASIASAAQAPVKRLEVPRLEPRRAARVEAAAIGSERPRPSGNGDGRLPKGERAILTAAAQHGTVTREQLTVLTGYKRSARDTYLQRLRAAGFLEGDAALAATPAGVAALGHFEELPTGDELRGHWLARLPLGERRILEAVCGAYPQSITRDSIDETTGYKRSARDTYLQRLGARRLVVLTRGGDVLANEDLFG